MTTEPKKITPPLVEQALRSIVKELDVALDFIDTGRIQKGREHLGQMRRQIKECLPEEKA